jgi:hypothetical protein
MGVVYEAEQLSLNRRVALKILPFAAALDPRQLQRFKNEALAAGNLHHEHIVPVYGVGCECGVHFYAMQYIDGLSLAAIIHELRRIAGREAADSQQPGSSLPTPAATGSATPPLAALTSEGSIRSPEFFHHVARLGAEAAEALAQTHQMGVLHRDIKPANLLVDARGSLWITDFGLAQVRSDTRLTITGDLVGTLRYMSPEQALAKRIAVDRRTDIYSLGATLYELLTLEPAFDGRDREELLRQIAFDDPKPPRRLNRRIPADLETIVLTAMAKAPARRYGSAEKLAADLRAFLKGESIEAVPEGVPGRLWRVACRHFASVVSGLVAVIAVVALLSIAFRPHHIVSPQELEAQRQREALAKLERDLDERKKVTLIEKHGFPAYHRWMTDETRGKVALAPDGAFSVQHWEYGLVELLPDPRLQRYRFRARVRHDAVSHVEGRVGIYFGHSMHLANGMGFHWYCNVAFSDRIDLAKPLPGGGPKRNVVRLEVHRKPHAGLFNQSFVIPNISTDFIPAMPVGAPGPWRDLFVEVQPEKCEVFWEGRSIGTVLRPDLLQIVNNLFAPLGEPLGPDPLFEPRHGLGLFVNQGVASFQSVTIEPIGGEN